MGSFYRALSKQLIKGYVQQRAVVPWYQQEQQLSLVEQWWKDTCYPVWFKYVKGPYERYQYEHAVAELRGYGLMFDDQHNDKDPIVERAIELLPHDLAVGRHRRLMRAFEMNTKKTHLPVEEQNYDPMVPYLAPFMEEAKFQMQEEQELLNFHPWDRRLYSGPTTGFGETSPYTCFSCW
uniref:Cytochrome b-c1 complex subunit 7 n=1 Tax=Zooxanthella nutricula TaxID=1333877 RepID=A0A7S2LJ82_9DINO